jgi:hypothetical protein
MLQRASRQCCRGGSDINLGPCGGACAGQAALFITDAANFLADPVLEDEIFGAASLVVRCRATSSNSGSSPSTSTDS